MALPAVQQTLHLLYEIQHLNDSCFPEQYIDVHTATHCVLISKCAYARLIDTVNNNNVNVWLTATVAIPFLAKDLLSKLFRHHLSPLAISDM